jgi:antirestriction protein ArdC
MKLLTQELRATLIANGITNAERENPVDFKPAVKFFTPWGGCTWLITELAPEDPDIAFGLCDLGMGFPELGTVRISELESVRGPMGLRVERDLYFEAAKTLSEYADEAARSNASTREGGAAMANTDRKPRRDVYQEITDQIVGQLETGARPWHRPWSGDHLADRIATPLRHNGLAYRGINILTLWLTASLRGYTSPYWMTFRQALLLGGCVRKGEKGTLTVFANALTRTEIDANGADVETEIHYLKGYTVFCADQVEGLPSNFYARPEPVASPLARIEAAEDFFRRLRAEIRHGGNQAYYAMRDDRIQMPPFDAFESALAYYATLAHESTHWTRHPSRLDRSFDQKRFGDKGYAMEELVAELGSAFLCATLELAPVARDDHAGYLAHWLAVLKADKRAIFTAAAHAQRAADFLHGLQPQPLGRAA